MFDAYTIKKVMPRLVIAAILIQLSWPLFTGLIYITGQIAWGIEGLLYAPFGGREALNVGALIGQAANGGVDVTLVGVLGLTAGIGGVIALGPAGLLSLGITVLLALLIAFFVLAIRQVVLVVLLVTAPLALVAWILPNTEKLWKLWWESFSKLLLMYPMILLLIAGGRVAAKIAAEVSADSSANDGFGIAIVVLAFFAPFFLIPKTFQLAGSAFANIAGIANNRSRGAFDRLKNFRGQQISQRHQDRMDAKSRFSRTAAGSLYRRGASFGSNGSWSLSSAGRQRWQQQEQMVQDKAASEMLEKGGARAFNDDDASLLARDITMTRARFVREYQALGHTEDEAQRALARAELATGSRMGSRAMAVAAQRFRVSMTNTAYEPGQAGIEVMQHELQGMIQQGMITEYDAAGWMKANRGRADFSSNSFGGTVNFVRGRDDDGNAYTGADQLAGAFRGADPREVLGSHQRTVEAFAEQAQRNLSDALESGDQGTIDKAMADVANIHSMLSSVSPQKAEEWANSVFSQPTSLTITRSVPGGGTEQVEATVRQYIDVLRSDERNHPAFHDRVREYGSARDAAAAGAAAEGAAPPQPE